MPTLSSKITGMQLWTYDIARRPDKTLDNGNPKFLSYAKANSQQDVIVPTTQQPTEMVSQAINHISYVWDVNHASYGSNLSTHGIKWHSSDDIDQEVKTIKNVSVQNFNNVMYVGDDIYFQAKMNPNTGEELPTSIKANKVAFTTKTQGIKILDQTGIVPINIGYGVLIFEVAKGYKIPVGATIKATPKQGKPETFQVVYEMLSGIYEITLTDDGWLECDVDFATVQDIPILPHSTLTFNLSHCTVTPNETDVENGVHSWTFTADEGYIFDKTGGIENPNTGAQGTQIPATNTNVTYLNNYNITHSTTITLTANVQPVTTIPFVQTLNHVRSNVTSASISRTLNAISLTADTGYTFQSSIQLLFYSGGQVVSEYNVDGNNTDSITIPLNTTKENTITSNMDNIQLTASATLATSQAGYEHNYLITETELSSFSNEHIWGYVGGSQDETTYNVSQYIDNLIELPFKVIADTTVNKISVGNVQSTIVSHETKARFVTLDLGTINVPAKYNNGYDYQNKTVKLYTPFVDPITINNENAIDKIIHIVYEIDISNGNLTVNLYNDNVLFFTGSHNIASQLPFLNTLKNTIINRDTHFNDNDIRKPYLVVTRETPILNNDYYPTIERGLIKNYNGNIQVRLLNNMNIPNNELSELTSQLESGVQYAKSN